MSALLRLQTYNSWCIPSAAVMSAVCQHTHTTKNHTFSQFVCEDSIIKLLSPSKAGLPAHDFCNVSLTLEFRDGYTSPAHDPFNISKLLCGQCIREFCEIYDFYVLY